MYRHDIAKPKRDITIGTAQFTAALRRILIEFRTDRKGSPGKYAKRIENVVAGSSPIKRGVLSFLIDTGVIKMEVRQYVINKDAMKQLELSMHMLARLDEENTHKAYVSYLIWRNGKR